MKGFLNLSNEECLEVSPTLFNNANVLITTAEDASLKGNYGVACSLMILGTEELVKALIVFLKGYGVTVFKVKEFREVFHKHKTKHETALLIKAIATMFQILDVYEPKTITQKHVQKHWISNVISGLKKGLKVMTFLIEFGDDVSWWEKANDLKNNGFYVGYRDALLLPQNITNETYQEVKRNSDKVKTHIRTVELLLKREKNPREIIKLLNEGIELTL